MHAVMAPISWAYFHFFMSMLRPTVHHTMDILIRGLIKFIIMSLVPPEYAVRATHRQPKDHSPSANL